MDNATSWTNSSLGPVRDSLYVVIPVTVVYACIFLSGLVGNIVTCVVIARNKHMHTATNYYLFSLALSDLLLLVSGLPQEVYSIWSRYPYIFGDAFCVLRGLAAETSANATVLTITAFTIERYVAICHPFLSHNLSKLSRALRLIAAIWLAALTLAVPQALQFGVVYGDTEVAVFCVAKRTLVEHSFEISTFVFFVAPMTLITVLYVLIGLRLRSSNRMRRPSEGQAGLEPRATMRKRSEQDENGDSCRHYTSPASRRLVKMLVAVVVAFFICWAPFHAQRLVAIYGTTSDELPASPAMLLVYAVVTYISGILYYLNTSINPLLYHLMSHKFRGAFKDTLGGCFGLPPRCIQHESYSMLSKRSSEVKLRPMWQCHTMSSAKTNGRRPSIAPVTSSV